MPTLARRALDHAADRAVGSPHAEAVYLAGLIVGGVVAWALLAAGRALSR